MIWHSTFPLCSVDRLSAQDVISVRKVLDYVFSKMEPKSSTDEERGPENFEIICQEQVSYCICQLVHRSIYVCIVHNDLYMCSC